ncbi:formate dehydrogenase [Pseudoroseomonas deserti]|uniref:Formate dehydrogenase n=1 Tax=Teichococcus deserti TaxID=1817963 RepID=A0A1V2H081_9PROT|nr:FdhF/YdeP family oxidoreductase [Pseudoroseomonas deserti]ONG51081.1 formate dehydrogenase [Pseudoroseomonas deserti]
MGKDGRLRVVAYDGPSGGWGSVRSLGKILKREGNPLSAPLLLTQQNKPGGFSCVSCAWAKPATPHLFEFCENGAKATAWDMSSARIEADVFARHTVTELERWSDHALEQAGRLTEPMRWDAASDRYVPASWQEAFDGIGAGLRGIAPDRAVFYASGRASNEAAFLWQLMARLHGTNNLPDSSNMCHESTSVALPKTIGVPVGTVHLDDFEQTDCILLFGQNTAVNSPRMLHQLDAASRRGVPIIVINPLREPGLERFTNPQSPAGMLGGGSQRIASQYHQPRAGGDLALLVGLCKLLLDWDDAARAAGRPAVLDHGFIAEHCHGFPAFAATIRGHGWTALEQRSGLSRSAMEQIAQSYAGARATLGIYGMGLTQHREGVENVQMLVALLLMRGNIGRPGAGICPVRGHSNVQGQRAVWITEKPELAPIAAMEARYGFAAPRQQGLDAVGLTQGVIDGKVDAVLQLGGNLVRSLPETGLLEPAWRRLPLTVMITTRLNRSHLVHGRAAWLLPCLSRIEIDQQASGPQVVTVEDSTAVIHPSRGMRSPVSPALLSEPAIIAGIAKAVLPANPRVDWDGWVGDYDRIRQELAALHPTWYANYSQRIWQKGGLARANPARQRQWQTETGKATFLAPMAIEADADMAEEGGDVLRLITLRSNDQFNTTVYGYDDRFRGIHGSREVVMMHAADIARLGLVEQQRVTLETVAGDGVTRRVDGLAVVRYDLTPGCIAGYFPECNPLLPVSHHARESHVPAAKAIPVRILHR